MSPQDALGIVRVMIGLSSNAIRLLNALRLAKELETYYKIAIKNCNRCAGKKRLPQFIYSKGNCKDELEQKEFQQTKA